MRIRVKLHTDENFATYGCNLCLCQNVNKQGFTKKVVNIISIPAFLANMFAESASFGGGRINKTNNAYNINYFITDHLGSTRVIQ
jgi:hypothetical protein